MPCPRIFRLSLAQLFIWGALAAASGTAEAGSPWQKSCELHSAGNKIKHVATAKLLKKGLDKPWKNHK